MRISWAMLANAAEAREGLAFIIAGGIDTVYSDQLPAPLHAAMVVRFAYRPAEAGKHILRFVVIDEDGEQIHGIDGEIELAANAEVPASWDQGAVFAFGIVGMPLPRYGNYRIDILVDGRAEADLNLRVVRRPGPNRAQRRSRKAA